MPCANAGHLIVANASPPPQTQQQAQVELLIQEEADLYASRQGIPRQTYLRSPSGMAAAFIAMNQVHGEVYNVDTDEAEDSETGVHGETRPRTSLSSTCTRTTFTMTIVGRDNSGYGTPLVATTIQDALESGIGRAGTRSEILQIRLLPEGHVLRQRHHSCATQYISVCRSIQDTPV